MFTTINDTQYRVTTKPEAPDSYTYEVEVEKKVDDMWEEIDQEEMREIWPILEDRDIINNDQ